MRPENTIKLTLAVCTAVGISPSDNKKQPTSKQPILCAAPESELA